MSLRSNPHPEANPVAASPSIRRRHGPVGRGPVGLWLVAVAALLASCGDDGGTGERTTSTVLVDGKPLIVVTYSVLGDVVSQLVEDAATVQVIIPNGQDPHDYAPSAQDVEAMRGAALVVSNGLDLEEGMEDALTSLEGDGIPVFHASDHVTLRELSEEEQPIDEAAHSDPGHSDEHGHGGEDPHLWADPLVMQEMAPALAAQLEQVLGVNLDDELAAVEAEMTELDDEVREIMSVVPSGECRLVTGHESLGYFADRYGCELIGAVIPSLSSSAEASAKDLAELLDVATSAGVAAIFTEVGTPSDVAAQVASEVGVPLIELPSHSLPATGGYQAFIIELATKVAAGLTGA